MTDQKQLTLLVVILHDLDSFPNLLNAWKEIGVPGITILQSVGGFQAQSLFNRTGIANLFGLFDQSKPHQRTLISLIDDQDLLEKAIAEADKVVRGFDRPSSGILFTLPAGIALGLQKWGSKREAEIELSEDSKPSPLLQWFEEDLKARGEKGMLEFWRERRNTSVGQIVQQLSLKPTIVRMDTPLPEVVHQMVENPAFETVCVVNSEDRLMGLIAQYQLGEAMLVPIVPEEFLENPDDYARALEVANGKRPEIAADIMQSPTYVHLDDTLDVVYQRMHKAKLVGVPIVDDKYKVLGYLSLMEVLNACYPDTDHGTTDM